MTLLLWQPAERQEPSPLTAGDFVLTTANGPLSLAQMRGKIVILYFGYTWCPDVCPTSLALLGMALHKLDAQELAQIQPIFISVDPARDTVERLAEYTAYFHPALRGATGTPQQIADVAQRYGVAYAREQNGSSTDYTVDHSSLTYLLDRNGKLHEVLPHGAPPDKIVAAIRQLLAR
ncbi:SCO family protein [Sulfurivermis fontis]|uniref:SCO family protein n=1 Tax=Sulfurivermis fontis TaxID=1972068 RepID=UPI001E3BB0CD|nr:SCO family protein [Sulfurivermis fontis]